MTALDLAVLIIILLTAACVALAVYAWRERRRATKSTQSAAALAICADMHLQDMDNLQRRLDAAERRYASLQAIYVVLVRWRLAQNFAIVDRTIQWRSRRP